MAGQVQKEKIRGRSIVSNGSRLFLSELGVSGHSQLYRRFRDIADDLTADLGGDLSTAQEILVRKVAAISLQTEIMEAGLVRTGDMDKRNYGHLTYQLRTALQSLGLHRAAKNVTPQDPHTSTLLEAD